MSKNETLEELMKQKKEIEAKIRAIKTGDHIKVGRVTFDKCHFPTDRQDEYYISVNVIPPEGYGASKYYLQNGFNTKIVRSYTREDAAEQLDKIIKDLTELLNKLEHQNQA